MAESSNIKARDIVKGVFSSYAPVTMNSIDSARTVASDIRTIGRKINTGMRQNMMQIDKSQPGRRAIALFNAAKDALKDGTYEINQANDGMYDDFEEYESSFTLDDMTEDERANSSPEEIILRGNRGVAQSVIRATTAQLEGMDAVSNKVLRGFIKTADASTKSINATIIYGTNMLSTQLGTMNTKLDAINANLVNLIEYQNENTTTYYEKNLEIMNSMLESMNNLNAMTRGKGARDLKNFNVRNGFNIKDYIDRVKKGIKNSAMVSGAGMITSMTNMAKENPDIMSLGEIYGNGLAMVASMIPAIGNKMQKVTKIDKRASQYINETLLKIGDKLGSNMLATMLGLDSLGNQRRRNYGIDMSGYMKDQIPWNGKAQKALTEVIPELLTSIDAGINKTDKRYFDYEQGYFKSRKEIEQDFADQVSTSISLEFNEMINRLGKKFDLSGKTPEEIAAAKSKVSNIINNRIYGEGDLSTARQEMADTLQSMNLSANEFSSAFNNIEQAISSVTDQIAELYSRVGSTDSVFRNINNRSGATSRDAIGKEAYRTLKAYRTSGAKETSIFKDGVTTDVKETIDRITRTIQAEIPEFRMTTEYKQYINMAVRRGDDDYEILRAVKNTFGKSNAIDLAKKKIYGLFGKDVPIPVPEASDDDNIDLGRYGNAVDMALLQRVYGVKTNYPGVKATYQSNKEEKSKSRSKNGVGDTTLTNKAASSQRSRMDGKSAGAEVAHAKTSPSEGMSSEFPIDQNTENLKGAIIDAASQSADKILNADDSSLDRDEKLRDTAAQAIIDIGKEGSTSFGGALKNALDTMVLSMGSMMSSFTSFGARLFGKEGIIKNFFKSDAFKSGMNKVKEFLIGDENGIFKDQWAKAKAFGRKTWNKTKDKLTDAYDWVYRNYSTYKYGEGYEEKEDWQNDKIMQKLNLKKRREEKKADLAAQMESATDKLKEGKSSVPEVKKTADEVKSSVDQVAAETPIVLKESVEKIADAGSEAAQDLKESTEKITAAMIEDPKAKPEDIKKKYGKTFIDKVKSILPKVGAGAIIGAGVGFLNGAGGASLLGSMFLPTGLIGGAIVGGGLTILSQTEAFRSLMFGKKDKDGNRSGGLISKNLKDKFKKAAPIAVGGAVTGMISSILKAPLTGGSGLGVLGMQLLPGGILGGAIMGMGVGLLKNSDTFKNILFGKQDENGERKGTWLSKSFGNMKQKMAGVSPFLKNALKGGAVGAVTGATLAHMGVLGAAVSSGPIGMGIAGLGIGIASSTKKFQDWLFGTEEFDDNGKSLGRKGGILGRVKNLININVVEPISTSFRSAMLDMIDWTKDKITMPFRTAFGPILDSIKGIKDNVVDFVKGQFENIGNGITSMIKKTLGTLFSPITKLIGGIGKAMIGGAKVGIKAAALPLTAGLSAMNFLTSGTRRKEYAKFYKHYYTEGGIMESLRGYWDAEQKDYDEEAAEYNAEAIKNGKATKKAKKVGTFDKISDFLGAITGNGVIADAARKGYNKSMSEGGQNTMDWRSVVRERKQMKKDAQKRHDAERQWNEISKLSRSIGNKDLGGRNVTLNETQFKKYKDKFVKAGIDPSLINTNDDLMQLIYDPQGFRKKASGDSNIDGFMQALKDYRLTPEEVASMKRTEEYQDNVTKYLESFSKKFEAIGEEVLFDRSVTSYTEDRKKDTKRLRNKLKKAYKTSLWEGRQAINLNDPELYEYDIEGITDEDLQDYAASNFADNNDFKGYLESIGRKMSPNDNRVAYHSAVKVNGVWKRTTGKSSEERPPESKPNSTEGAVITNDTSTNVNETTTQPETNNRFDWKQAVEEANRNKKKGKSSEEKPPESKPNTNDATQAAVLDELKQTRELQEANLELQSGGEITADDVKKNGYKDFGKSKMSKFSIGGVLTNLFNRKSKEDKTKEAAAKEAEEQKQATALGDEANQTNEKSEGAMIVKEEETKEKKKSIFSRIFGAIGSGFTIFGSSKIGKLLIGGVKLFGGLGLAAGIGLTIAEMTKPGTADNIGASIQKWNDETLKAAEDGTFIDKIKSRISGWFDKFTTFMDEKVLSKDGYLVKAATKVGETIPSIFENFVIPGIQRGADFITKNADTIVGAAGDVLIAIAPPLAQAIGEVLPEVFKSLGKGLWNNATGKKSVTKGKANLTTDEQNAIIEKGGSYKDNWVEINEEEAITAQENGMDVKQDTSGKYFVNNAYTLDSNKYIDKSGKERTAGKNSFTSRLKYLGARVLSNAIIGNHAGNATIAKTAIKGLAAGAGGYLGGITHILGGIPGMIAGGATGTTVGYKLGGKLVKAGSSVLNKLSPLFSKFTGKTATKAAAESANVVLTDLNKAVFNTGTKAITENAGENALSVVLQNGAKTAGSGIDDVAKIATSNHTKTLQKLIDVFKTIPDSKIVKTIAKRFGSSKLGAIVKGVSTWCKKVIEKLGRMVLEVSKGTKLGKNITKILTKAEENNLRSDAQATTARFTAGLSEIIFVGYGMISGATHPEELFEVSKSSVDWKMRLIAALIEGLLNSTIGLKVSIVFMLLQLFLGFNAEKWVASFLYKNISIDKEERTAKLEDAQDQLAVECAIYNQENGTNMSVSEFNNVINRSGLSYLWGKIRGTNIDSDRIRSKASEIINNGDYSKDSNGNITIKNSSKYITKDSNTSNINYGSGPNSNAKIVYGNPYAQGNSEWANMPIGTFANGKVSTMGTGGCGPTALSAIANMYGNGMSPADMGKYASLNGYITQGGANERLFTEGAARLGMQSSKVNKGNLKNAIDSGTPTIISGKNSGPFTKAGHVVVANGTDRNGNAIILDPSDGKIKHYKPSQLVSGMTDAWSYAVGYGNTNPITIGNMPGFGFNTLGNPTISTDVNMALNANSPLSSEAREEALRKVYDPLGIMTKEQLTTTLKNDGKADVASRLDDKYSNKKSTSEGKSSNETYNIDAPSINETETTIDWIPDLKESLNKEHTTLGGLLGAFTNFGYAMKAVLGVIKGEGSFTDIYNNLKNGISSDSASGDIITADTNFTADTEKTKIWKWLRKNGFNNEASAAVMGCWENETGNRAQTIEANWISEFPGYNVVPADRNALNDFTINGVFKRTKNVKKSAYLASDGKYYPGIGYPQWTGNRAMKFLNWTASENKAWNLPDTQLEYFDKELNSSYTTTKNNLKSATSLEEATKVFFEGYEMGKNAATKHPAKYNARLASAKAIYDTYANSGMVNEDRSKYRYGNKKANEGYGRGPVGFGPDEDDGPSNLSELLSGVSTFNTYMQSKLNELGIGDYFNFNGSSYYTDDSGSVSFDPSMWANSSDQMKPVNAMKSIIGKLNYTQDGAKQNPDKGTGSCASTVAWAYNKTLGIRPGDTVGSTSYMRSTEQSKDNRFTTIWTNNGSGLTDDFVKNYMQPGDIVYQNWDQTYNNGKMGHTEMYAGNGQTLSHGGPNWEDKGPVYKNLLSNSRKKHTMMIRRYNGFLNNNTTGYGQGSSNDRLALENNFLREVDEQKNRVNKTRLSKEGDRTVGFGPGSDTSNLEERLDKIFNVITEWYFMEKKKYNTKGFGPSTVTNTTVVNNDNSTKVIKTSEKKQTKVDFNSNLDKLTQKHSAFARMYKTSI